MIDEATRELLEAGTDVDWFADLEPHTLEKHLKTLQRVISRAQAVEANVLVALNRSWGTAKPSDTAQANRKATGESSRQSHRKARRAALFDRWPRISKALADGDITAGHADLLTGVPQRFHPQLEASLETLLAQARRQPVDEFKATVAEWKERTALEAGEDIHRQRRDRRTCSIHHDSDGMTRISALLDPESGAVVEKAITSRAQQILREDQADDHAQSRSFGQRCADALADVCGGDKNSPHGGSSGVLVTIPLADLQAGLGGRILGGPTVSAETVRRLACTHGVIPAVLDSDSTVLDLGHKTRLATPAQRLALAARYDSSCAVPDCDAPFHWCHIHHIDHWENGGATDLENLIPVCTRHHTQIHDGRLEIVRHDGKDEWKRKPVRAGPLAEALRRGMNGWSRRP